jgi:prepilin-type N-terminal cleavage/methylation domain-containing protein
MKRLKSKFQAGFSLLELMIAMVIMLVIMGLVSTMLGRSLNIRSRESRKTDALTSAQAALNIMSREISNAGFGIYEGSAFTQSASNGIVLSDSGQNALRFRANLTNVGTGSASTMGCPPACTNEPGEDVTYFFDNTTASIVRYDPHGVQTSPGVYGPQTSVVVNKISNITFSYYDYQDDGTVTADPGNNVPTSRTGRVRLTVEVQLEPVRDEPNETVKFTSEINLRNSGYMLRQY